MLMRRRPLLRTAAVGGGAYLAGRNLARRKAADEQAQATQDDRISTLEQQKAGTGSAPAAPAAAEGQGAEPSMLDQLSRLADLHKQGALTDTEFAAAKARLLDT